MVKHMSGGQFEVFVASILRSLGYRITVLGGSGDQGVDVIAAAGNERIAIQCKNYRKRVGNKPVQEVYAGARHHRCTDAWVVAPEGFTKGAVTLARSVGVSLYDASSLQNWIRQIDKQGRAQGQFEANVVDLDEYTESGVVDLDAMEVGMGSGVEKHEVRVGKPSGNVGETVRFTANLLGTALVNGGAEGGGMDYTFYQLSDGTFRVLVKAGGIALLEPSDMQEAIARGQRNNFRYGRMTLAEMRAHSFNFGDVYDQFMREHPATVANRIRDID
jgi:hypothetical protein